MLYMPFWFAGQQPTAGTRFGNIMPDSYAMQHVHAASSADLQTTGDTRGARRGSSLSYEASPASTGPVDRHSAGKGLWVGRWEVAVPIAIWVWRLRVSACSCRCCSCRCSRMHGHGASAPTPVWPHVHAIPHEHAWRRVADVRSARGALQRPIYCAWLEPIRKPYA